MRGVKRMRLRDEVSMKIEAQSRDDKGRDDGCGRDEEREIKVEKGKERRKKIGLGDKVRHGGEKTHTQKKIKTQMTVDRGRENR